MGVGRGRVRGVKRDHAVKMIRCIWTTMKLHEFGLHSLMLQIWLARAGFHRCVVRGCVVRGDGASEKVL